VRAEIFALITGRIIASDGNMRVFLSLLGRLLSKRSYMIDDHLARVQDVLQYMPFLQPESALALLHAITPLLRSSRKEVGQPEAGTSDECALF